MSGTRFHRVVCLSALFVMTALIGAPATLFADDEDPTPRACSCTLGGPTAVCVGQTITLSVTSNVGVNPASYLWVQIGGTGSVTFTTPSLSSTGVVGVTPGTVRIECQIIDDGTGLCGRCDPRYDIVVNANPTANAGPDHAVCAGSAAFALPVGGGPVAGGGSGSGYTYSWTIDNGGTLTNPLTENPTFSPITNPPGVYQACVVVTDSNGCFSVADCTTLTVYANPTCSITGSDPVCAGTTNSYSGPGGMSSWAWSITGDGTISGASNAQSVNVIAGAFGSYILSLTVVDSNSCTSTCQKTVNINPSPACSIGGPNAVCDGTTNNHDGPPGMVSYAWSISGDGGIVGLSNQDTVSVLAGPAGAYTLTLVIIDGNGCENTCQKPVTVNANPACTISGPDPVCAGTTHNYSGPGGMSSYAWTISGSGTINPPSNAASVSVTAGASGSYTLFLTIVDGNGCTGNCSKPVTIEALPDTTISHNAGGPLCPNWAGYVASVPVPCAPAMGLPTYSWSISAGGTLLLPTNQPSVGFKVDGTQPTVTLTVTVTGCNGCSATNSMMFNVCQTGTCQTGQLRLEGPPANTCFKNNDTFTVQLYMDNVSCPAAGFQAFIGYNGGKLQYLGAGSSYTTVPFGLSNPPINDTIGSLNHPALGRINLSALVNPLIGQVPVTGTNILLATLQFKVTGNDGCDDAYVYFRPDPFVGEPTRPPTRLTDLSGFGFGTITQVPVSVAGLVVVNPASIRIDGTVPTATQGSIAACYTSTAAADAAALAATTSLSDNCSGPVTKAVQTGSAEACSTSVVVRVQDGCGNFTDYTYNTRVDDTPPTATQGSIAACYTSVAAANQAALDATTNLDDNCDPLNAGNTITKSVLTSATVDCSTNIVIRVADTCGNHVDKTYTTRVDNTAPVINSAFTTGFEVADGFQTAPGRNINGQPRNRSANGQSGWFVEYGGNTEDEEITSASAHSGTQAWRISNWYSNGIVVHAASPGIATPAGESGTMNAALVPAGSNVFRAEFYWKTASATPDDSIVQISPDGGAGSRWGGRLDITNFSTPEPSFDGSHPVAAGAQLHWNTIVSDTDSVISSPVLNQNTWYRTVLTVTFVPGVTNPTTPNDVVTIQVYDPSNVLVWNVVPTPGVSTWELAGYGGPAAVDRLVWRTKFNTSHLAGPGGYSGPVPAGFYFDDLSLSTGPTPIASCYPTLAAAEAAAIAATMAAATDNCPGPLTPSASTVGDCSAVVSVTVSDGCGNISAPATFHTRIDNTPPVSSMINPMLSNLGCFASLAAAEAAAVANSQATDNCPGVLTPHVVADPDLPRCNGDPSNGNYTIFVHFTDGCGNQNLPLIYTAKVDNVPPTATQGTIASCFTTTSAADAAALAATTALIDNCPEAVSKFVLTGSTVACDTSVIIRVQDDCGNYTDYTYSTRVDNTPPVITCPANITVTPPVDVCTATLQLVDPFDTAPSTCATQTPNCWYVDRYPPNCFTNAVFDGGNRLKQCISSADSYGNRPGPYQSVFYNTQGRKYDVNMALGTELSVRLYVPASWATDARSAMMWATTYDSNNDISGFPILAFTANDPNDALNPNPAPGNVVPRFRAFTQDTDQNPGNGYTPGYVDLGLPPLFAYDQWVTLKIKLTPAAYEFTVVTAQGNLTFNDAITFGSIRFGDAMLQGYNFSDAGHPVGDSYDIHWDNMTVGPNGPIVTDDCEIASITYVRSDNALLTWADPFPQGVTTVTWTATDSCGNPSSCDQTVTVNGSTINVTVELSPIISPLPVQRCITFEVWDCAGPTMQTTSVLMTFVDGGGGKAIATGSICVPINNPTCVTARDKLHTLRSRVQVGDGLTGSGPTFVADFTGKRADEPGAIPMVDVGHRLIGGNLNDDAFIDILDFGTWAGQYFVNYGSGDTTCSTPAPHADISGDGDVLSGDFTFIAINFLMFQEANCCGMMNLIAGSNPEGELTAQLAPEGFSDHRAPMMRISNAELRQRGLDDLIAGDINRDGWVDVNDVVLAWIGVPPAPVPQTPVKKPRAEGTLTPISGDTLSPNAESIRPAPRRK